MLLKYKGKSESNQYMLAIQLSYPLIKNLQKKDFQVV